MKKIDLITFLNYYCGESNSSLSRKRLSHEDIRILFSNIKVCDNYTYDDLARGDVIGVYDNTKRVKYYYNPRKYVESIIDNQTEEDNEKRISLDNINNLSKEELLKLRRKLRLNNQRKESYIINKFIRFIKRQEPHEYREKKKKLLLKESYYD